MADLEVRLEEVVATRHAQLPMVDSVIDEWTTVQAQVRALQESLERARQVEDLDEAVLLAARQLDASRIEERLRDLEQQSARLRDRFSRETINIGVSGAARVGKSTLLQSISGLDDDQVPTGAGRPVTAVRSQIFNSGERSEALVAFYSWRRFVDDVLRPLHLSLGIGSVPRDGESWRALDYDSVVVDDRSGDAPANLIRLREMHKSIDSILQLLGKPVTAVDLGEVRPFISYAELGATERPHFAVEWVQIFCPFPEMDAAALGLMDLPGLGEIAPKAEEHHVAMLANDVDLVVMVKRPDEQSSYWGTKDAAAYRLIQEARGAISRSSDFTAIALNVGGAKAELRDALRESVGRDMPSVPVYEIDAADTADVRTRLLIPLLDHLAERLPVMDSEVMDAVLAQSRSEAAALLTTTQEMVKALAAPSMTGSAAQLLTDKLEDLKLDLAHNLMRLVGELKKRIGSDSDVGYGEAVERCFESAMQWIDDESFPEGISDRILKRMEMSGGSGKTTEFEINRIRVEVDRFFSDMDAYFEAEIDQIAAQVGAILRESLGEDLVPKTLESRQDLLSLADTLDAAEEPSGSMAAALREFVGTSYSYRTNLYPDVREAVRGSLDYQWVDQDGKICTVGPFDVTPDGASDLVSEMKSRGRQGTFRSQQALLTKAEGPARLLHAVVERLADRMLRDESSEREFAGLARSYRDSIWPGQFEEFMSTRRASATLRRDARSLQEQLGRMTGAENVQY